MQALRLLAVNGHQILRIVRRKRREKSGQFLILSGLLHQALGCAGKLFEFVPSLILHHELEAAELTQSLNRRW